jgi:hypothetical protein
MKGFAGSLEQFILVSRQGRLLKPIPLSCSKLFGARYAAEELQ